MFFAVLLAAAIAAPAPIPVQCAPATAFTGTICSSPTSGKHRAIILVGGSEGGDMLAHTAAQFVPHGYVAASVAYFGAPGLPSTLQNIPVETIGKAIADIAARPDVDAGRIAIMGLSKGGEFVLLAASLYPQIHAVVADVPSPFAWEGIAQGPGAPASSWTYQGKPLPYVSYDTQMGPMIGAAFSTHAPLDLRAGYDAAMQQNAAQIAPATFHLENIRGPIMMIAADDDHIWDSVAQSQLGMSYLNAHHHPYNDVYLHYAGAGHAFLFSTPSRPMTQASMGPMTLLLGGTAAANVAAARQAWPKIYAFLNEALK